MKSIREVVESPYTVGIDERLVIGLTTTPWGAAPTSVAVTAWKYTESTQAYSDVTSSVFPVNTPAVNGDAITLSPLVPQAIGDKYRIDFKFTSGGSILEAFAIVFVER